MGVAGVTGELPFLQEETVPIELFPLKVGEGVVTVEVRPTAAGERVTYDAALVEAPLQWTGNARLPVTEMAEIALIVRVLLPVTGDGQDFIAVTGAAEIDTTVKRNIVRGRDDGEASEEPVPRVRKMHVVAGVAGELVVSLDDRLQGKDLQFLDPVSQSPDGEVDGVEGVVPLSVTLLAEKDGAVSLRDQRNLEVVLAGHLVGEIGSLPLMAATAGEGVVGIGTGLEIDLFFRAPVEVQVGGNRRS